MELRNKYISAHPYPPQDLAPHFEQHATLVTSSPSMKKGQFRRRQDPEYDVFSRRVADRLDGYTYRPENGIFGVYRTPTEGEVTANAEGSPNMYPVTSFQEFVADFEYVSSSLSSPIPFFSLSLFFYPFFSADDIDGLICSIPYFHRCGGWCTAVPSSPSGSSA